MCTVCGDINRGHHCLVLYPPAQSPSLYPLCILYVALLVLLILLRGIIHYSEACVLRVHTTRHISKAKSCKVTISPNNGDYCQETTQTLDLAWHIFASLMTDIWWLHHRTIKIKWFQQTIWTECVCGCGLCLPHWWRTNIDLIYIDHSVWKTSQGRPGYDLTFPLCQQNILIWLCLSWSRINADTWSIWNTLSFPFDFVFIHCTWTYISTSEGGILCRLYLFKYCIWWYPPCLVLRAH